MRVFLCQSYMGSDSSFQPVFPLGLSYIASEIMFEHEVQCYDPNVARTEDPMNELSKRLEEMNPHVVGVSLRNVDSAVSPIGKSYYYSFVSTLKTIKKTAPFAKIVVGGPGFSLFAREIIHRNPVIDYGVVLQGEHALKQLLKDMGHPEKVDNLIFSRDGKVHFTSIKRIEDFESSSEPSRELFDMPAYVKKPNSVNVLSKRGCAFKCIFCPNNYISGYHCQVRSPKKVAEEIEHLKNNYGVENLRFADSTFNHPFSQARSICQEILKRKIKISWTADFHAAFINESFIRDGVSSGCSVFNFSPDAASDRALAALGKGMRVEHIKKTVSLIKNFKNAKASYSFMYGLPYYNSENTYGLVWLISRLASELRKQLSSISLTKIRIYPFTDVYNLAINNGIINKDTNLLNPIYYPATSVISPENMTTLLLTKSYYFFELTKNLFINREPSVSSTVIPATKDTKLLSKNTVLL